MKSLRLQEQPSPSCREDEEDEEDEENEEDSLNQTYLMFKNSIKSKYFHDVMINIRNCCYSGFSWFCL